MAATSRAAGGGAQSPAPGLSPAGYGHMGYPVDLAVQVIPLRRPEHFETPALQCTEPGDLLHEAICGASSVTAAPQLDIATATMLPAVTYPPRDGAGQPRYLLGELYRATLVIHNGSPHEVQQVSARVEIVDPRNAKRVVADLSPQPLRAFATLEQRLENYEWAAAGRHNVKALVHYTDPTRAGEMRTVDCVIPITVSTGLRVVEQRVEPIPARRMPLAARPDAASSSATGAALGNDSLVGAPSAAAAAAGGAGAPAFEDVLAAHYRCTAVVVNPTHGPLQLTELVFRRATTAHEAIVVEDTCGVPAAIQRDGLWLPGESRQFTFEVSVLPSPAAPLAMAGATGADARTSAGALDLGMMRWGWRRPNGDGGHGSTPHHFQRPALVPLVSSLMPAGIDPRGSPVPAAALKPPALVVRAFAPTAVPLETGVPTELRFAVLNLTPQRVDVVAQIAADRLLPRFLFAGSTTVALGPIEPKGTAVLAFEAVPLTDGVLTVDGSCFELWDARRLAAAAANDPSVARAVPLWPSSDDVRGNEPQDIIVGEYLACQATALDTDAAV